MRARLSMLPTYIIPVSILSIINSFKACPAYLYKVKTFFLYLMVALYVAAGINHFWHERVYLRIMPPYIPAPLAMVYISGVCEILFGLLLLPEATRHTGAWLIIVLLIAVFPANVQMAVNSWRHHDPRLWILILRLPLQVPLIWWAYIYTR
jgi:uncharacterized membrane protein